MLSIGAKPLTPRRAMRIIVAVTALVTVLGGVLIWIVDRREFPDLATSLWWAVQTVTTVGYGDVVPHQGSGRVIGTIVMLNGIALIALTTAAVTAALVEQARRRRGPATDAGLESRLDRIDARLDTIEKALRGREDG